MSHLALKGVSKSFGKKEIIPPLDLDIPLGQFVVLLGPSGCGKSTLLRLIAGLEEVSSGQIFLGGRDITPLPPRARELAMVFQSYALYPHMNVFDNMAFGLKMRGFAKGDIYSRVMEAAQFLQLESHLLARPGSLSGGQRQRVAMGRALVRQPKVFLFDEPLSNLDAKLRGELRHEIKRIHERLKTTTIYVTHDQEEAMALADRIIVVQEGRVAQDGSPLDIYQQPKSQFIATFLGHPKMNLLSLKKSEESAAICVGEVEITREGLRGLSGATVGFRPDAISLKKGPEEEWLGECQVDICERFGSYTLVYGQLPEGPVTFMTKELDVSGRIACYADPKKGYLFHPDSKELLPL